MKENRKIGTACRNPVDDCTSKTLSKGTPLEEHQQLTNPVQTGRTTCTMLKKVRFDPILIKRPSSRADKKAPAAIRIANKLMDKFPRGTSSYPYAAAVDSGATGTFINENYKGRKHWKINPVDAISVECANNNFMTSTCTDELDLQKHPAKRCDKFKGMNTSLMGVEPMDAEGCATVFYNHQVKAIRPKDNVIHIPGEEVMEGLFDSTTGLYMTNLHDNIKHYRIANAGRPDQILTKAPAAADVVVDDCPYPRFRSMGSSPREHRRHRANAMTIRTVPALINYYHMTLGAPPIKSWLNAINKGWFVSWPGLTAASVRKYCSDKPQTTYGHMQLQRQGVDSTKSADDYEYVPAVTSIATTANKPKCSKRH